MAANEKKLRFGVVGAGKLGGFHCRTLASMPEVELIGVSDPNLMRAQKLAWDYNCVAYRDMDELIPQVDALVLPVPTELHARMGVQALNAGKHVLVEKPIANSEEGAMALLEAAEKNKVVLQVGHSEKFNPAVVETLKHVKNPRYVTIERLGPFDPRVAATGVVLDLMIHDLDIILTMIDSEVESLEAIGASLFSNHEDICNARIKFKNGCIADVTASRATMEASRRMRIYQQDAYLAVDYVSARLKIYRKKTPILSSLKDIEVTVPKLEKKQPIREELYHFIECIKNSKKPINSGEKGLNAVHLALAITREMRRYNISARKDQETQESFSRNLSDIGKAGKVMLEAGLMNAGIDK